MNPGVASVVVAPRSPIRALALSGHHINAYVSFLVLWPHSPVVARVTGQLMAVEHRAHTVRLALAHFEPGFSPDETWFEISADTELRLLPDRPEEGSL